MKLNYESFWEKVNADGPVPSIEGWTRGNCWLWKANTTKRGYGVFTPRLSQSVRAHRWAYERVFGPIPKDTPQLDHLCRVRNCVRPTHLEPVTGAENIRRGQTGKWQISQYGFKSDTPEYFREWRRRNPERSKAIVNRYRKAKATRSSQ